MNTLTDTLNSLESISLKEMDNVKLMDRVDTKYIFSIQQLPLYLDAIKENYRVLEVNDYRMINYESLYFDTKDFEFYRQHHNGKMNRYKIRFRKYVESNLNFFEIKLKSNKGRTIKNRINYKQTDEIIKDKAQVFLEKNTHLSATCYSAVMWINYTRVTLVNRFSTERVTIDTNLHFKTKDAEKKIHNLVIAEVKQEKSRQSAFVRLMKNNHIREGFMSKYCFGISSLVEGIRKNNFKRQLIQFNKLQQHATTSHE